MTGKRFCKMILTGTVLLSVMPVAAAPRREAVLPRIGREGFYAIDIPYPVAGMAKPGFSDLRIRDGEGEEVAYFIREEEYAAGARTYIPYSAETVVSSGKTDVLIATEGRPVSSFILRVKNADVDKTASLKGSNDRKHWYVVKDRIFFMQNNDPVRTETELTVNFPLSDYDYYCLSVTDSLSAPLNILSVGWIKEKAVSTPDFITVPYTSWQQKEEGDHTDIMLSFPGKYAFREIVVYISAPRYYHRPVRITVPSRGVVGKHKKFRRRASFSEDTAYWYGVLDSDSENRLHPAYPFYTDTLKIRIDNGDDQPLTIDSIQARIPHAVAVAWLRPGEGYRLTYGDEQASLPQYDLSFRTKVPDSLPLLRIGEIRDLPVRSSVVSPWGHFWKTYGIWLIIVLVIIQILYIVRRILVSRH